MPLVKAALKADIENSLKPIFAASHTADQAAALIADAVAAAVDTYVKTALVSVVVTTTGTAAAQTGTGTGSLS